MFESLALIGGFWFFLLAIAFLVAGIVSAECDNLWGACLTLILLAGTSELLFDIPILASISQNPILIVAGLAAYIVVALLYAVFYRYPCFLRNKAESITQEWINFLSKHPGETRDAFRLSTYYHRYTPSYNADRISTWALLWPWAIFWDLCHKPARWVYNTLYALAGRMLDNVGSKVSDSIIDVEQNKNKNKNKNKK